MKSTKLEKLNACKEAIMWVATQKNYKEAWQNCDRGDWMLWLAAKLKVDKRKLILAKALTAKLVSHLMIDNRSIDAINVAIRYGNHKANDEELNAAANAAYAAANAAYAAANAAANAAAYAAVNAAVNAAYAAVNAAANAAYAAARRDILKRSADICRDILTDDIMLAYRKLK